MVCSPGAPHTSWPCIARTHHGRRAWPGNYRTRICGIARDRITRRRMTLRGLRRAFLPPLNHDPFRFTPVHHLTIMATRCGAGLRAPWYSDIAAGSVGSLTGLHRRARPRISRVRSSRVKRRARSASPPGGRGRRPGRCVITAGQVIGTLQVAHHRQEGHDGGEDNRLPSTTISAAARRMRRSGPGSVAPATRSIWATAAESPPTSSSGITPPREDGDAGLAQH